MDARKRVDQRVSLTDAMMVLRSGQAAAYLWDGLPMPYGTTSAAHVHAPPVPPPLHAPPPPSNHAYHNHLDHHHHHHPYPHQYHPSAAHYGGGSSAASWLMHGAGGARSANGGYSSHQTGANGGASWALDAAVAAAAASGGIGPMRTLGYGQHGRSYRPYASNGGSGSAQRTRGGFK